MKTALSRRGADTNQNIFYLVMSIFLIGAAAYGLDLAFRTHTASKTRESIIMASENIRSQYYSLGRIDGVNVNDMIQMELFPPYIVRSETVGGNVTRTLQTPYEGAVSVGSANAGEDLTIGVTFAASSGKSRGLCTQAISDAPIGTRITRGSMGREYTVSSANCNSASPSFVIQYHRDI